MSTTDQIVGFHLDIKFQMPSKAYLLEWLKRLPEWGVNTLLIEYEDKFPFTTYPFIRDPEAFTPEELGAFLGTARAAGITTIPLVQTFSHLEFALKHDELAHLREREDIHTHICPSKPEAVEFVRDLIRDMMTAHDTDGYVHLGGDEAWFQGTCPECQAWVERGSKAAMWGEHESQFARQVIEAGKVPIFWDDMFWENPPSIAQSGLPKETLLHCWNYAKREYKEGIFKQVEAYHDAGYGTLAAPCLDWGVLAPQHSHCLGNTRAWAEKLRRFSMRGMINTAWACFHVPIPAKNMYIAATAAMCRGETVDAAWEDGWCEREYGATVPGYSDAMETVGELWEEKVKDGLGRPVTFPLWGYMDMVLHWPNAHEDRMRYGTYPLDWAEIDFNGIYLKKIDLAKDSPRAAEIIDRARLMAGRYAAAHPVLAELAGKATRNRDEVALLALFAEMKHVFTQVLLYHLTGDGDRQKLTAQVAALGPRLRTALTGCLEPRSVERMMTIWHEPVSDSL